MPFLSNDNFCLFATGTSNWLLSMEGMLIVPNLQQSAISNTSRNPSDATERCNQVALILPIEEITAIRPIRLQSSYRSSLLGILFLMSIEIFFSENMLSRDDLHAAYLTHHINSSQLASLVQYSLLLRSPDSINTRSDNLLLYLLVPIIIVFVTVYFCAPILECNIVSLVCNGPRYVR